MTNLEKIDYELDNTSIIPEEMRYPLARAVSYLPENIIDFVIENYFFICMDKDDRGIYIAKNDFRLENKQGIIILPATLWLEDKQRIAFVIAHEVAHAYKKHGFISNEDTDHILNTKREREADKQAVKWLKPHFKGSFRKYLYKDWQLS